MATVPRINKEALRRILESEGGNGALHKALSAILKLRGAQILRISRHMQEPPEVAISALQKLEEFGVVEMDQKSEDPIFCQYGLSTSALLQQKELGDLEGK